MIYKIEDLKNSGEKFLKPICLIAARGNSKGVPKKNIKNFAGKPLIAHAIISALNSKYFKK